VITALSAGSPKRRSPLNCATEYQRAAWTGCGSSVRGCAYVCASRAVIDLLKTRARTVVYSTAPPASCIAAAIAALAVIESEPDLIAAPLANARAFTDALGLPEAQSPIVPGIVGEAHAALAASKALEDQGFLVVAIRQPTVPAGTARLRIAFSAGHSKTDVARLVQAVRPIVAQL